ncbi:hypothetical protein F5X99DRAFT_172452 [Biscogniauxia marginata]|nr:hypothetical protein F5X99DRAFT_172452 [Biscogniauxia marginata]
MWDPDNIRKIENKLSGIRDEIHTRILVNLRNKVEQSQNKSHLHSLEMLEQVVNSQEKSAENSKHLIKLGTDTENIGKGQNDQLIALNNYMFDEPNPISASRTPSPVPLEQWEMGPTKTGNEGTENKILSSLWYAHIEDREGGISNARSETFLWIYEEPKERSKIWYSFVKFLEGPLPNYWITRKPGSGKSTLMKFIARNPRTHDHLELWAKDRFILTASFYFWRHGPDLQKTEFGLLRSLLHSILSQRRDLIPFAFSNRFQAAIHAMNLHGASLLETRAALKRLISSCSQICFFFVIDGLDEFDPAVSGTTIKSLIGSILSLRGFSNVKVVVSSRPLIESEHEYKHWPSLSVHGLTKADISHYTMEKSQKHPGLEYSIKGFSTISHAIVSSIVEQPEGMFLWAKVVTDLLLQEPINYDTTVDLQRQSTQLPSEIQGLYRMFLSGIAPVDRYDTARDFHFLATRIEGLHNWNEITGKLTTEEYSTAQHDSAGMGIMDRNFPVLKIDCASPWNHSDSLFTHVDNDEESLSHAKPMI